MKITVGYTKSDMANGYSSFGDGYREGAEQHVLEIEVDDFDLEWTAAQVGEYVWMATNHPEPELLPSTGLAAEIRRAIDATGYNGREAHFSLSTGDTVEVNGERVACEDLRWRTL